MNPTTDPITEAMGGDALFTAAEVAARYGIAVQTLANMRLAKTGPRYVKMPGGRVRYRLSDLADWEATFSDAMAA